jgi:hypothetical protein
LFFFFLLVLLLFPAAGWAEIVVIVARLYNMKQQLSTCHLMRVFKTKKQPKTHHTFLFWPFSSTCGRPIVVVGQKNIIII